MNHLERSLLTRTRFGALAFVGAGVLGLVAACSSDGGNAQPNGPVVITTGGGGSGGSGTGDAGDSAGGTSAHAGSTGHAGNGNGGSGGGVIGGDAGQGGETSEAGAGPISPTCPTGDLGFLNQDSTSQKAVFDNVKRLGAHATLPPLP